MQHDARGFIGSLFDFGFNSFITTKLITVVYGLSMFFNALITLSVVAVAFWVGFFAGVLTLLLIAPVVFLFLTMISRLSMELVIVLFRIAEHMKVTADNTGQMVRSGLVP
jgi:uncharacterized membrane protein